MDTEVSPDISELQQAVRAADPAAFLVPARILRRVIVEHCRLVGFEIKVPHRKSYIIDLEPLLEIVDLEELGNRTGVSLPRRVILLAQPDPRKMAGMTWGEALVYCWRLLFHARVHMALEDRIVGGALSAAGIRQRIRQIGSLEFKEIRTVLDQEDMLLPPCDDAAVYVEFAAVYLELQCFAWRFLPHYFPGMENPGLIDELLAKDIDARKILQATRPSGAPDPQDRSPLDNQDHWPMEGEEVDFTPLPPVERPSEVKYRRLVRRAQRPSALGNVVGAAIWRARAERWAPPELAARAHAAVREDINHLVDRLMSALDIRQRNTQAWADALLALVEQTPRGIWTVEARLLYDLQKACVDHEREIYTIDVVEWALSLGRRPIKRPLPQQREVLLSKHLRTAARRLAAVRISGVQRVQLSALLREATQKLEDRVRVQFRPMIARVLDEVGLVPQNMPERVSRKKLIEELLDRIVERGYSSMGDLRDALSSNQVKLPDLAKVNDLLHGDQLLRADRRLSLVLDGVCRRGEAYLRWMQRFSAVAFGTRLGRFLTRYLVVPFGSAFMVAAGIYYLTEDFFDVQLPIYNWHTILPLGLFFFGLLNVARFRHGANRFFRTVFKYLRLYAIDPLIWITHTLLVQRLLQSRWFRLTWRFALLPLMLTYLLWWLIPMRVLPNWLTETGAALSIFLAINLALNSRSGRKLKEIAWEWCVQNIQRYGTKVLLGGFYLLIDIFKIALEYTERLLYSVDEWLRFRSGQSRTSMILKGVLGVFWFYITYLVRFAVNLLIEPQFNPLKHFPVVTVSHKFVYAGLYIFADIFQSIMATFGYDFSDAESRWITGGIIWCIPGIFGFLAWELRENWRLYAANRPEFLRRVSIGHHGESMARLLRPGFYSGTIPKRFAKLRRAERKARAKGNWKAARKHLAVLNQIEESILHFVQREFVTLLGESKCWQSAPLAVQDIHLATNRVRVALWRAEAPYADLEITFEVQSHWLLARAASPGWIAQLKPKQRQVLSAALAGLYKLGAADLVYQQVESALLPLTPFFEADIEGLVIWPGDSPEVQVRYNLVDDGSIAAPGYIGPANRVFPTVVRSKFVFRDVPIPWNCWVDFWERDQIGGLESGDNLAPIVILPAQ
jgi:hypothetical protein